MYQQQGGAQPGAGAGFNGAGDAGNTSSSNSGAEDADFEEVK